ncbi:protein-methionine-sulfoxide reductase heme-binding subunit MsrQ [Thaumasiovibrio subtropicus]|uniref:protein-methionine-sulfoxide reductase heme-binding subunit MsrQ n=1 Tax=Thaumasiovibrio subtropicus TaxID=1891207 RepID=UPI000B34EB2A|nr:protein-methionine-sulfoxide reductase heme-binding subunit MsrQ [Thaumasiovibrio subtropicus]
MVLKLTPKRLLGLKIVIHTLNVIAFVYLVVAVLSGAMGADPLQEMSHYTGKAGLHLLILTLLVSPIAKRFKLGQLMRVRRLLGLYCFSWALIHVLIYFWLDLGLSLTLFFEETTRRPYLILGLIAFLLLTALAITSFKTLQAKMGKRWQQLHNTVYLIALLAPIHYLWSVKSGLTSPFLYLLGFILLLAMRWSKLKQTVTKLSFNQQ